MLLELDDATASAVARAEPPADLVRYAAGVDLFGGWAHWGRAGRRNAIEGSKRYAGGVPLVRRDRHLDRLWTWVCPVPTCLVMRDGHDTVRIARAAWFEHCDGNPDHPADFAPAWPDSVPVEPEPTPSPLMRTVADFRRAAQPGSIWRCDNKLHPHVSGPRRVLSGKTVLHWDGERADGTPIESGRLEFPKAKACRFEGDSIHFLRDVGDDRIAYTWTLVSAASSQAEAAESAAIDALFDDLLAELANDPELVPAPEQCAAVHELVDIAHEAEQEGRHEDAARAYETRAARIRAGESIWELTRWRGKKWALVPASGKRGGVYQEFTSRRAAEDWQRNADVSTAEMMDERAREQRQLAGPAVDEDAIEALFDDLLAELREPEPVDLSRALREEARRILSTCTADTPSRDVLWSAGVIVAGHAGDFDRPTFTADDLKTEHQGGNLDGGRWYLADRKGFTVTNDGMSGALVVKVKWDDVAKLVGPDTITPAMRAEIKDAMRTRLAHTQEHDWKPGKSQTWSADTDRINREWYAIEDRCYAAAAAVWNAVRPVPAHA